jgi:hypothetical protein
MLSGVCQAHGRQLVQSAARFCRCVLPIRWPSACCVHGVRCLLNVLLCVLFAPFAAYLHSTHHLCP